MNAKLLLQFYIASFVAHTQTLLLQIKHHRPFYLFTAYVIYLLFCGYYHINLFMRIIPLVVYLISFLIETQDHPHTYYMRQSPFSSKVLQTTPQLEKEYKSAVKPMSGHILTVYASQTNPTFNLEYNRETIELKDGGICGLDHLKCELSEDTPINFILPGILGDTKSHYIKKVVKYSFDNGFRPIVYIKRGLDGLELKNDKMFNAISCDDVYECIQHIHKKYPKCLINVIGYSLGGSLAVRLSYTYSNELLNYNVNAICAVCPIWGVSSIDTPALYVGSLVQEYKNIVMKHKDIFANKEVDGKKIYDLAQIEKCKTCKDMEEHLITPMFGYKNVNQYYWDVEQWFQNLPVTKIPTYTLTSFDDPVLNDQGYSYLRVKALSGFSPFVINSYTQRGGHCIFSEDLDINTTSYADRNCLAFINTVTDLNKSGELKEMRKYCEENYKWFNE